MASMDTPTANDNGIAQAKQMQTQTQATPGSMPPPQQRRVLGDMSPNVKLANSPVGLLNKPLQSSPLKRSFTARAEERLGLQYLKRRKLSTEKPLSQVIAEESQGSNQETSQTRSMFGDSTRAESDDGTFQPLLPSPPQDYAPTVPAIQETQPSPTEPNTPSSPRSNTSEVQGSSADRHSFSSLINYDPSSQISAVASKHSTSKAEILRLRLKVAMYKVNTNQVGVPFDRLEIDSKNPRTTSEAVEEAVAELRREAQADLARRQARRQQELSIPKLQPGPVLNPTGYDVYEPAVPSSPPTGRSLERRYPRDMDGATPHRTAIGRPDEAELTSSVVKGRVAEGLLGLRHAL